MRATIAVTTLACALFLSACGIKGPLFLPPVPAENETAPAENGDHDDVWPAPGDNSAVQP
jgi:predicted small lipoprotein YifL